MRKRKTVRNICLNTAILVFLLFGCTSDVTVIDDADINENTVIENDENASDILETAEDSTVREEIESGESDSYITENMEFKYDMDEDFIVNYNEVFAENETFAELAVPDNIIRGEDTVGEFCEGFPEELQQILVYCNDSVSEGDNAWLKYRADYEIISNDETSDISFADLASDVGDHFSSLRVIDIDLDGEDEYIAVRDTGTSHRIQMIVMKYNDEYHKWGIIGHGTAPFDGAVTGILEYEGKKYILLGNVLAYWNDEYDRITSDDSEMPWNAMAVNRKVAGYTPVEMYGREEDSIDYLAEIDLENIGNNAERDYYFRGWYCGTWYMSREYDWERVYDGKTYLYVVSNFDYIGGWPQDDLLLTIFEEGEDGMEAVKIYYLAAHYKLTFKDNQCSIYGPWYTGGMG